MPSNGSSVTGYLRGGLGNQLFIAAAAFAASRRLDVPLQLDHSFLRRKRQHVGDVDRIDLGATPTGMSQRWLMAEPERLRLLGRSALRAKRLYVEPHFAYDAGIEAITPGTTLLGYFQSWRYFDDCGEALRARLSQVADPTDWYQATRRALDEQGAWIGVHVRQGDYLNPEIARKHGNVTAAYIERALAVLEQQGHTGPIVLFSDHPSSARQLSPRLADAVAIDPPAGSHPIESINLMASASALITSNSSFSWWGGYLGDRSGRTVVCPRPWFGDLGQDTRDLLLPHWLTVERRDFGPRDHPGSVHLGSHSTLGA